jgi:hypothetical protein
VEKLSYELLKFFLAQFTFSLLPALIEFYIQISGIPVEAVSISSCEIFVVFLVKFHFCCWKLHKL